MILNESLIQNGSTLIANDSLNLTVIIQLVMSIKTWLLSNLVNLIAIGISLITLWLTHLRGARISLINKNLKIKLNDLSDERFKPGYIPFYLPIKDLNLFFINSGNRAGIVMGVQAKICLEDYAKTWLEPFETIIKYGKESESEQALIIPDRSGGHVALKQLGFNIKGITKEKFEKFDEIEESDNLIEIINAIYHKQQNNLEQFIELILRKKIFSELRISYKYTCERYWESECIQEKQLILQIENQYETTIEKYQKILNEWDSFPPTIDVVIPKLNRFLLYCRDIINRNMNELRKMKAPTNLLDNNYNDALNTYSFEHNLLKKWKTSKTSEQELDSLFLKMKKYSDLISDASKYKMDVYNERTKISKEELISKCDEIIPKLDDLIKRLEDELKVLQDGNKFDKKRKAEDK